MSNTGMTVPVDPYQLLTPLAERSTRPGLFRPFLALKLLMIAGLVWVALTVGFALVGIATGGPTAVEGGAQPNSIHFTATTSPSI